jgi:hypothetical protein
MMDSVLDFVNVERFRRFEALSSASLGRTLFITARGRLGVGPKYLEPTDIVCILFGGDLLYALRPIPGSGEHYFLGECYVHGLMSGEAMKPFEQGEVSSQTFHLR